MITMDIFNQDAFKAQTMTAALDKTPYVPGFLGTRGLFEGANMKGIRTLTASFEKRDGVLTLVQTSGRNEPVKSRAREKRDIRSVDLRNVRLALADSISADELLAIREFGSETELKQVLKEVMERQMKLRDDIMLTHENHRLGAIQGIVLDADGSELFDWFDFWGITPAADIGFNFNTSSSDGSIRTKCTEIYREMQRAAKGAWTPQTTIEAVVGDVFYDKLIAAKETRETVLNWNAAASLREPTAFRTFRYGDVDFVNYRGTDDNSTVAVESDEAHFYPVNARETFQRINAPGEGMTLAQQPGQPLYAQILKDPSGREAYVDVEVSSHSLYVCLRPEMLRKGVAA